jgi:thiol-disulfide isomerase/thioredoxin
MFSETSDSAQAPELSSPRWLNTPHRIDMKDLRGRVVLVNIWDYTCVNSLRTLPYMNAWHQRYAHLGLTVIGVHTPQFAFGREQQQVAQAVLELGVEYPVYLDNDYAIWNAYENHFWPAAYLIDQHGRIRVRHYGDGRQSELEQSLQSLLREADSNIDLPPLMHFFDEDETSRCVRTVDLRSGLQRGALGNPEGYAGHIPMLYRLPRRRPPGAFYVAGAWQADAEYLAYQGSEGGLIQIPYEAQEVYAVLSPHADTVERTINPRTVRVEIWQDEQPIYEERRGVDINEAGQVLVSRPRTYNLIRNADKGPHELTLRVHARGFALYGFSFVQGA